MRKFADVFSIKPGKTELIEHHIETGHTKPIKQAFQAMVRQELKEMLNQGIIEPSVSEWAAPIVPIVGFLRLCVDYRRLNATSQTNAYPMPRIDDLIDQLGQAEFLSTLDLTRGYWQVQWAELLAIKLLLLLPPDSFNLQSCHLGSV